MTSLSQRAKGRLKSVGRKMWRRLQGARQPLTPAQTQSRLAAVYRAGRAPPRTARPVLVWAPGGLTLMLHLEAALAAALNVRGIPAHVVTCDAPYRACVLRATTKAVPVAQWADECAPCIELTGEVIRDFGVTHSGMSRFVTPEQRQALWEQTAGVTWATVDQVAYQGVELGRHVRAAIIRYLQGTELAGNEAVVREYAYSALVCAAAATEAIRQLRPVRMFLSHGGYVDWGPAMQVALAHGIPVTGWSGSYLHGHFYLKQITDGTRKDLHRLSPADWATRRHRPLTPVENQRLDRYLASRYKDAQSFDLQNLAPYRGDVEATRQQFQLDPQRPAWVILAHISWDAAGDSAPMAYDSFETWMAATLKQVIPLTEAQWLIKIHPAEAWHVPARSVQGQIERLFSPLPSHVRVITPHEKVNPLDLFEAVDGGVTVFGTSGLELALLGKPVIVAGEAHYSGKGFTWDGYDRDRYEALLRAAPTLGPLTPEQLRLTRRYAYAYLIQRQIPLRMMHGTGQKWWKFQFEKQQLLAPGMDEYVDFVCQRMMAGREFLLDERLVSRAESLAW